MSETSYAAQAIPPELGDWLRQRLGLERAPATLGDMIVSLDEIVWTEAFPPPTAEVCSSDASRHEVRLGERTHYTHCALDALALPLISKETGAIRSESPQSGTIVEILVTPDSVDAKPREAVISFGVLREGSGTYQEVACRFINAFPSIEEYERWAAATPEAVTMALPVAGAFALPVAGAFALARAMARGSG